MKIAIVHTRYRERGGEDIAFEAETELLRRFGHEVETIVFDNAELARRPVVHGAAATIWNRQAAHRVRRTLTAIRPDVVHTHNTFPAASPAVFAAARSYPQVHTLHNYRWACVAATLQRGGVTCELCLGRSPWAGVVHACYGGSRPASAVVATTLWWHRQRGTLRHVDRFIALTEFARSKLVAAGLPADRMVVEPNFTANGLPRSSKPHEPYALFVGRLVRDKGVQVLADAWHRGDLPRLVVVGDGPQRASLEGIDGVTVLGTQPTEAVRQHLAAAHVLLMPSLSYEGLPLALIEAYAAGLPVIASDMGSLSEHVEPGLTGWCVPPGSADALAATVKTAFGMSDEDWSAMSSACLTRHQERYGAAGHHDRLVRIYRDAIEAAGQRIGGAGPSLRATSDAPP